jgi:hypothetical protein
MLDKELEHNNAKLGDLEKSNKGSKKKNNYGKGNDDESRTLLKNGMPDDSMIFYGANKSKFPIFIKIIFININRQKQTKERPRGTKNPND